jgi:hypothetical protein
MSDRKGDTPLFLKLIGCRFAGTGTGCRVPAPKGSVPFLLAVVLSLHAFAADEPSKIYECKDASGKIVYQGDPCVEPMPTPVPKTQAVAKPHSAARPAHATKPVAAPPARPSSKAPPPVDSPSMPPPRMPAAEPAPPTGPADPKFAKPEIVLRMFVDAVKAGDRALVLSCLTSHALADLGPEASALPMEALRKTVDSFTGFVSEGDVGPYWSVRALRAGTRPKWIFFERTGSGEWKIGAI